jgi:hypothetical protein
MIMMAHHVQVAPLKVTVTLQIQRTAVEVRVIPPLAITTISALKHYRAAWGMVKKTVAKNNMKDMKLNKFVISI